MRRESISIHWQDNYRCDVDIIQDRRSTTDDYIDIKLSIVIATYNRAAHLRILLQSIFRQKISYGIEIILVDDASTDETVNIASTYPNINIYRLTNNFGSEALAQNVGMYFSRGTYICYIDSDDYLLDPESLNRMSDAFDADDRVCFAISNVVFQVESREINPALKWVEQEAKYIARDTDSYFEYKSSIHSLYIRRAAVYEIFDLMTYAYAIGLRMFKTSVFRHVGGWPLILRGNDDYGALLNIAALCYNNNAYIMQLVDCDAYVYRISSSQASEFSHENYDAARSYLINIIRKLKITYEDIKTASRRQVTEGKTSILDRWNLTEREI